MPPKAAVVDAFKNLIRYGKHHNHVNKNDQQSTLPDDSHLPNPKHRQPATSAPEVPKRAPSPPPPKQDPQPAPAHHAEAAQYIVEEERKQKSMMPIYKGLEDYEILDKMGDGAFSNVYKAVETKTGKRVAIKVVRKFELNASQAGDKHLNQQFKKKTRVTERANILKEVQIMRGTTHPSVVKLYSFSESDEHYFLVMELMEGGELFHQIVKLTYFSENLSRHVILQVAQGIRYLHEERGVVHRDIKPENLLFERIPIIPSKNPVHRPYDEAKEDEGEFVAGVGGGGIGRVKIADFGLSKIVWDEQTMTPCGTVGYTAPEIVKDERYSKSVDMWALGCVLYTLLCGFPPFYDESINVLTEKVARGYYTFLSPWWDDISHSAKDLISHLLCVDPTQRYTIDQFLAHPWCNAAPAPPPPPTPFIYDHLKNRPLDSPLLTAARHGREYEGRSPGVAALKEAFDITYAVHRMEEEGARRNKYGGRQAGGGFLAGLNEDDEDDENDSDVESDREHDRRQQHQPAPSVNAVADQQAHLAHRSVMDGRAGPRDQGTATQTARVVNAAGAGTYAGYGGGASKQRKTRTAPRTFELDMDGATLLGRRQRHGGNNNAANVPSPLKMQNLRMDDVALPAGSPMRL